MVEVKRMMICVGDIYGYFDWFKVLWCNLELKLGLEVFVSLMVIFLGDYNDRGFDIKGVFEFFVGLLEWYLK